MADDDRGARLRRAREERYKTASDAARAMGVPVGTYIGHENGSRDIPADAGLRYAKFFRVNFQWLMTGEGMPRSGSSLQQRFDGLPKEAQRDFLNYVEFLEQKHRQS